MAKIRFARYAASVSVIGLVGALVAAGAGAGAASAASDAAGNGDVKTTVRKSASISGTASGNITSTSLVTQVSAVGNGTMNVQVPLGANPSGLRNLNAFGGVPIQGDSAVFNQAVNGSTEQRIMSNANVSPVKVQVSATLDGKSIKPEDVVGKTGVLDVKYTVTNTQTFKRTLTYTGADGNPVTQEVELNDPLVGTMDVTLPQNFVDITAPGASVVGDGHGGSALSYTMVLFGPLGAPVANMSYQTRITNGDFPAASFDILPVKPDNIPVIQSSKDLLTGANELGNNIYQIGNAVGSNATQLSTDAGSLLSSMTAAESSASSLANQLGGPITRNSARTAATAKRMAATAKAGMVTNAKAVISDIGNLQSAIGNIMGTAGSLPALQPLLSLIDQLIASANTVNSLSSPTGTMAQNVTAITGMGDCNATCQTALTSITSDLGTIQTQAVGSTPSSPGMTTMVGLTSLIAGYLQGPALQNMINGFIGNNAEYQQLIGAKATLKNSLVDSFTDICDSCFSHLVSGSQELATDLASNAASASGVVTQLQQGIVEGPDAMVSGMQTLQAEGTTALHQQGASTVTQYGLEVAQLNALQEAANEGVGVPYGNATGADTVTTGVYQLSLAGASSASKDNGINYLLGIILLVIAGAVGVVAWHRRQGGAA